VFPEGNVTFSEKEGNEKRKTLRGKKLEKGLQKGRVLAIILGWRGGHTLSDARQNAGQSSWEECDELES